MGCLFSSSGGGGALSRAEAYKVTTQKAERKPYSWEVADRPDPKDYMFMNKSNETLLRLPGSVNGQQFVIENCKECDIFTLDHTATVTIDDCVDCRIFLGPVESSVFIRDSRGITSRAFAREVFEDLAPTCCERMMKA